MIPPVPHIGYESKFSCHIFTPPLCISYYKGIWKALQEAEMNGSERRIYRGSPPPYISSSPTILETLHLFGAIRGGDFWAGISQVTLFNHDLSLPEICLAAFLLSKSWLFLWQLLRQEEARLPGGRTACLCLINSHGLIAINITFIITDLETK